MKARLFDEAQALLAYVDSVTDGAASKDDLVHFAWIGGDWAELIEALHEYAHEVGITLPDVDQQRTSA